MAFYYILGPPRPQIVKIFFLGLFSHKFLKTKAFSRIQMYRVFYIFIREIP